MIDPSTCRTSDTVPHRRLCLAADLEQYSRLDTRAQSDAQSDLVRLLDEAAARAGLDRSGWTRQPQGDLELAVLPESTSETTVLGSFVDQLAFCLGALNARPSSPRLRVRLAIDTGVAEAAALGHAGPAPVAVARFVNAPQLKGALAALTSANLAVIVSDRLYQDIVRGGHPGLDPAQYQRAHVQAKEFGGYGWIRVPGHGPDDMRTTVGGTDQPQPTPARSATGRASTSQYAHRGVVVGRDVGGDVNVGRDMIPRPIGPWRAW
ncbi:hypothetical protein ACFC58_41075 [Kitasatospora purpeofusca]|uniref:hypothetical protein n=1 Tax=Kitasatospora purpeofusca TaxID=67352 RepID=UPI0035DE8F9A